METLAGAYHFIANTSAQPLRVGCGAGIDRHHLEFGGQYFRKCAHCRSRVLEKSIAAHNSLASELILADFK